MTGLIASHNEPIQSGTFFSNREIGMTGLILINQRQTEVCRTSLFFCVIGVICGFF
jgi:hypothetical protein